MTETAGAIADLEERIEALHERIEHCRKAMLLSRIAIWAGGTVVAAAFLVGGVDRMVALVLLALSAIIGGFTWLGANRSTREEAERDLAAAEAARAEMIAALDLREIELPPQLNA
jgi:hypothetical protein